MNGANYKFYGVVRGRKVGVFEDWLTTNESVNGFSHNSYKGFNTIEDTLSYLTNAGLSNIEVQRKSGSISINEYKASYQHFSLQSEQDQNKDQNEKSVDPCNMDRDNTEVKEKLKLLQCNDANNNTCPDAAHDKIASTTNTSTNNGNTKIETPQQKSCPICSHPSDDYTLTCTICNMKVHYYCTHLPAYSVCYTKSDGRRKYVCENCSDTKEEVVLAIQQQQTAYQQLDSTEENVDKKGKDNSNARTTPRDDTTHTPATNERIDRLETTIRSIVEGLCEDMTNTKIMQLTTNVKSSQKECQTLKDQCKSLEAKIQSHTCTTQCNCTEKMRTSALKELELGENIHSLKEENSTLKIAIRDLEAAVQAKSKDLDLIFANLQSCKENNADLENQMAIKDTALQELVEQVQALELQLKDDDSTPWQHTPLQIIKVKGEENPLSNFYPCTINAFNTSFKSVEHALQYKKLFDHELYDEAEAIRSISSPKDAKARASELLGKSETIHWEDRCEKTMMALFEKKKDTCPKFVEDLKKAQGKQILHTVASPMWGTGNNNEGRNRFGVLLMVYRDKLFPNNSANQSSSQPQVDATPKVLILGNSQLNGVRANKLSRKFDATIEIASTIEQASEVIGKLETLPDVIALQLITNDVKQTDPSHVIDDYKELVSNIEHKIPTSKVIISSAPYNNNAADAKRIAFVNAALDHHYQDSEVKFITNRDVTSFQRDGIHLSYSGSSALARNLIMTINDSLCIRDDERVSRSPPPQNHRMYVQNHRSLDTSNYRNTGQNYRSFDPPPNYRNNGHFKGQRRY